MQSTDYRAAAELIGAQGGATIRFDPTISGRAHWHQPSRTINLNPNPEERARMPVAGMLAFELGNAAQSAQFQEILDEVRVGTINDGQEYARRCEMMEYRTAQLRAKASRTMIRQGGWNTYVDPMLRHFLEEGEVIQPRNGPAIVGTGLWLTFEGYFASQQQSGHAGRLVQRFDEIEPRIAYLASPEGKVAEARRRYHQRQRERQTIPADQPAPAGVTAPTRRPMVVVTNPAEFLRPEDVSLVASPDAQSRTYTARDGGLYRLSAVVNGEYFFRPVD